MFPRVLGTKVSIVAIQDCAPAIVPKVANIGAASALGFGPGEVLLDLVPWCVLSLNRWG